MDTENKILIKSSTRNLSAVRDFVEDNAKKYVDDFKIVNQIVLSVDEACTNIIKHTFKFSENHNIEIGYLVSDNKFIIFLKYNGEKFDPNTKDAPDMKEYFAKYKVGGLGIPLMKKFMDKIEYSYQIPDSNTLT